uniref:Uncharacterized protein n=1 Tax=viral metagenome TaxID=1070528 RepID=A0A6C0DB03_9ZZZZ
METSLPEWGNTTAPLAADRKAEHVTDKRAGVPLLVAASGGLGDS